MSDGYQFRYRFYVGEVQGKSPVPVTPEQWEQVQSLLITSFGGYTMQIASGAWGDHREPSRVYECISPYASEGHRVADLIKRAANQTSVLFTQEPVIGEFV